MGPVNFTRHVMAVLAVAFVVLLSVPPARAEPDAQPPIADAGPDQLVDFVTAAGFDGSASTDDVGIVSWRWTFEHDGEPVTLWGPVAYFPFTVHGDYEVTLNVTDGSGNWDTDTLLVTVLTPPGPPRSITAIDRDGFVDVSWGEAEDDGGSPVTGYIFYRGTCADDLEALYQTDLSPRFVRDTWVTNGVTYHYAVAALNEIWVGPMSVAVNATPIGPPPAPWNLTAVEGGGGVRLQWNAPNVTSGHAPVLGITVYRGTDPDLVEPIANLSLAYSYTDPDVETGRRYYYAVGTVSYLGGGPISEMVDVTVERQVDAREALFTVLLLVIPWIAIVWVMVDLSRK